MDYVFIVYKQDHKVRRRKVIYAESLHEAMLKIDDWCYYNGYVDFKLEGGKDK
jgi:hypothetical protein